MNQQRGRPVHKRLTGSGPAPTVGLFTDAIDGDYHRPIVRGALTAARDRGANLLCFVGGQVMPAAGPHDHDWVYAMSRPANVDGIVTLSGAIVHAVGTAGLAEFCAGYRPLPVCSTAIRLDGTSSVCVDNEAGMRTLVEHLVRVHGLKRIAFVRGPKASDEAEVRLRAYRTVLESSGIAYDPALVVEGDFLRASGREAARELIVERKLWPGSVDAVVACNDYMALGVLDQLRQQGVRVPEDIAVAGFDDCADSRFASPPLTTVGQPLEEQGREATRIVLDRVRAREPDEQSVRRTVLVVRRSCGCLPGAISDASSAPGAGLGRGFDAALLQTRQQVLADMQRAGRGELGAAGAQWESRLLNGIVEQIRGEASAFIRSYDDVLRRLLHANADVAVCNDVLSAMRGRLLSCIADPAQRTRAEDALHEARILTTTAVEGLCVGRHAHANSAARALMRSGAALASARDVAELQHAVHAHVPELGVPRCFVLVVEARPQGDVARLVVAERPERSTSGEQASAALPATEALRRWVLAPDDVHAFAIFPSRFEGNARAVIALELGDDVEDSTYEALRHFLSAALARLQPPSG